MNTEIVWNQDSKTVDLPQNENEFYKGLSEILTALPVPNRATVSCPYGTAVFDVIKKGGAAFIREDSNTICLPGAAAYPEVYLTCINPQWNNYKFYHLKQQGNEVIATYGRIGAERGEMYGERTYRYPLRMFWVKYNEKLAKGYVDQSKVYLSGEKTPDGGSKGKKAGQSQPVSDTPADVLYQLLRSFAKRHVETACVTSKITSGMVAASRKFLDTLYVRKTVEGFNNTLLQLLTVCPRRVSRVAELLANTKDDFPNIISREEDLLAAMEALAGSPSDTDQDMPREGFRNIEVYIANETQRQQVLAHLSTELHGKVKQIYRVIPKQQQDRFNAYVQKSGIKVVKQLWHGSRNENWLSIIENGLKLRPDAVITGKMFGDGIYFAPSSMKSWNYTSFRGTTWARGTSDKAFMALYATAYGEPLDTFAAQRFSQNTLGGKNCVHAHVGPALRNDEIVYYSEDAMGATRSCC